MSFNKQTILVLCGPPLVGKSTFAKKVLKRFWNCARVNKDSLRYMLSNKGSLDSRLEQLMSDFMPRFTDELLDKGYSVILDNTHCRWGYIKKIVDEYWEIANIKVIVFSEPLWKLRIRNCWRYITSGIWIPDKVIRQMMSNQELLIKEHGKESYFFTYEQAKEYYL